MLQAAPVYPKLKREQSKDSHLLVIDPADIHIGKLATAFETGDAYDVKIASDRVHEGVQGILDKTSSFNIDQILLIETAHHSTNGFNGKPQIVTNICARHR